MKRILSLLLTIMLVAGMTAAGAETAAGGDFAAGFMGWLSSIDLSGSDYAATVQTPSETERAVLRQDGAVTEIELEGQGRVQLSQNAIALEIQGQRYYIDLESILGMMQPMLTSGDMESEMEMLTPWLQKALMQILLPSAKLSIRPEGTMIHFEATAQELQERLYAFIDEMMAERTTLETLLKHYGAAVQMSVQGFPADFETLKSLWEAEKAQPAQWPDFALSADITTASAYGKPAEFSCAADITMEGRQICSLRLEFEETREGIQAHFALNAGENRASAASVDLEMRLGDGDVYFRLISGNRYTETYTLHIFRSSGEEIEPRIRWTAILTVEGSNMHSAREYTLDVELDPDQKTLYAVLNENDESETGQLARLDAAWSDTGIDGTLQVQEDKLYFRAAQGVMYTRVKVDYVPKDTYSAFSFDLWVYRQTGDARKIRAEVKAARGFHRIYTLETDPNRIEFDATDPLYGRMAYCKLYRKLSAKGFEAGLEYQNLFSNDKLYTGRIPLTVTIRKDGNLYRADIQLPSRDSEEEPQTYQIAMTENSENALTILATRNETEELGKLELRIEDGTVLTGNLSAAGTEQVTLKVEPAEKQGFEVIDQQKAFVINAKTLPLVLKMMSMGR